jgi:hypothetical protein
VDTVRLFADDCVLYRRIRSTEDTNALQDDINSLQNWERDWLMEFHPEKCQVLYYYFILNLANNCD